MADIGTGATITFATSAFAANIMSINGGPVTRESIDTSHLGSTAARSFIPGDLHDPGEIELEFQFDTEDPNTNPPPYDQAAETVTIKFPLATGDSVPAQVSFTAFVTAFSFANPLEALVTGTMTLKISGALTWANAS